MTLGPGVLEVRVKGERGPAPPKRWCACRSPELLVEMQTVAREGRGGPGEGRGFCTRVFETKGMRQLGARRLQRGPPKTQQT